MCKSAIFTMAIVLFTCAETAHAAELLWSDDFNHNELNDEIWREHYPGKRFSGYNDISAIDVHGDNLTITSEVRDGKNYTGMISTRGLKEFRSGYLEVKARFPVMRDGLKCSAILQSPDFGNKKIDPRLLPENTGSVVTLFQLTAKDPSRIFSSVSWGDFGEQLERKGSYVELGETEDSYHRFGINLKEDVYEFYINGKKYLEITEGISGVDMYLVISCEVKDSLGQFDSSELASRFSVDYVKLLDTRPLTPMVPTGLPILDDQWKIGKRSNIEFGNHDEDSGFERSQPDDTESIKVTLVEGSHLGADASFKLPGAVDEAWISYCIRFSDSWTTQTGGKLPGFAGNSSSWLSGGGQGGKPSDGSNSWSARMLYGSFDQISNGVPVGSYIYHTDQGAESDFGDVEWWAPPPARLFDKSVKLEHNKWYSVKQRLRINSEHKNDGIIEGWIDGQLVYSRDNFNFTNAHRHRRLYRFWLDVYHGGKEKSPHNQYVYFDQFNYSIGDDNTSTYCS